MMTALATFLLNNWKVIAIGLAIASLFAYIGVLKWQRDYYEGKADKLQLTLNQALEREEAWASGNKAITKKYENALVEVNKKATELQNLQEEKIKNDKELNSLRISRNAVRLFNESKRDPASTTTEAKQGNDGETQGAATFKGIARNDGVETPTVSLAVVWKQVSENDSNHWKCVHQVEAWQNFWQDFEMNYMGFK